MRTRIKICGITNLEDAQVAVHHGADALGFIFVPNTPRFITTETAYDIGYRIPPFVTKVAVVQDYSDYISVMPRSLDAVQYYVNTHKRYPAIGPPSYNHRRRIRAYRVCDMKSLDDVCATYSEAFAILLDTYHKDKLGGAGETFNWQIAAEAKQRFGLPIILAGGLTPENVGESIRTVRPFAVDVSSGVEASPGRKDHAKIKAFIEAVRAADAE